MSASHAGRIRARRVAIQPAPSCCNAKAHRTEGFPIPSESLIESLAMMEEVGVGARDVGRPVLWFTVSGDGWGALQVFDLDDERAVEILSSVREAHDLNGRVCVVTKTSEYGGIVRFKKLLAPARTKP